MNPEGFLNVDTPENVVFDMELAGIGSRFMAALVDTLLIAVLQAALFLALALVGSLTLIENLEWFGWLVAAAVLLSFVLLWGYYLLFEWRWNGQTPGKRLVGLRVMRVDGRPVTFVEVLIRNLVRLIDFLPVFYGLGVVVMAFQRQWRRLGDLAAGTLVVFEQKPVRLESLSRARRYDVVRSESLIPEGDRLPVERLAPTDIQRVEEFLDRWISLLDPKHVANAIHRSLMAQMGLPAPEEVNTTEAINRFRLILTQWEARQRRE
jgi:uncharacterized RDD family membrane protein YckC